jgi:hypothetical protein
MWEVRWSARPCRPASLASADASSAASGDASDLGACCGVGSLPPPTILLACLLLVVSLLHYAGGALEPLRWVALGAVAVGVPNIIRKAFGSLRNGVVGRCRFTLSNLRWNRLEPSV